MTDMWLSRSLSIAHCPYVDSKVRVLLKFKTFFAVLLCLLIKVSQRKSLDETRIKKGLVWCPKK